MSKEDLKKIDLNKSDMHMHSTCSDGLLSPSDLVYRAKEMGLETIAITDHDLVGGLKEALDAAAESGNITVIPGIELSTEGPGQTELHVLGYYIDPEDAKLKSTIAFLKKSRIDRNRKLFDALKSRGIHIDERDFENVPAGGYIGKPMIAKKMIEKGLIRHIPDAFQRGRFLESSDVSAVKKEKLSAQDAIRIIIDAGGDPVLAHPMKIRDIGIRGSEEFWKNLNGLLEILADWGLEGLECYYPDHTEHEIELLKRLAHQHQLEVTKGSDFHGYDY